jgi:hypothetical protein
LFRHLSLVIRHFPVNLSPDKKIAGVLVPLFALRGEDDLGIGDLGALRELIDWAAEIGFKLVQLLPINETGADNSPYNAISALRSSDNANLAKLSGRARARLRRPARGCRSFDCAQDKPLGTRGGAEAASKLNGVCSRDIREFFWSRQ